MGFGVFRVWGLGFRTDRYVQQGKQRLRPVRPHCESENDNTTNNTNSTNHNNDRRNKDNSINDSRKNDDNVLRT